MENMTKSRAKYLAMMLMKTAMHCKTEKAEAKLYHEKAKALAARFGFTLGGGGPLNEELDADTAWKVQLTFGKHEGWTFERLLKEDVGYWDWLVKKYEDGMFNGGKYLWEGKAIAALIKLSVEQSSNSKGLIG